MPRRRLRFWRYVSPGRRGVGVLLLLVLVSGLYMYWRLTNDNRIRREAVAYLTQVTGGTADVSNARFSLFGAIELRGVKVWLPGEDRPFFQAGTVMLQHRPWSLFFRGRLDVSEISCIEPVLNLVHDMGSGWNYETVLNAQARQKTPEPGSEPAALPSLMVRKARLTFAEKYDQHLLRKGSLDLNLVGLANGPGSYKIVLEKEDHDNGGPDASASVVANLQTGAVAFTGKLDLAQLSDALLLQYGRLKELYHLQGQVEIGGRWETKGGAGVLEANLASASLQLLPEQGGLRLHNVRGKVVFDGSGVRIENVTGKILQAGDANFAINGTYRGFDANAMMDLHVALGGFVVPATLDAVGPAADAMAFIHEHYRLEGSCDVDANIYRQASGEMGFDVAVRPNGMTIVDMKFPFPLHNTHGLLRFTQDSVDIEKLVGVNGTAQIEVNGKTTHLDERKTYIYDVAFRDLEFTPALEASLPAEHRGLWTSLSARGRGSGRAVVKVDPPGSAEQLEVDLTLDKRASMAYSGFPYRLENVAGDVHFSREGLRIGSLTGGVGSTRCTLEGGVAWHEGVGAEANLTITARVPLDEKLSAAVGGTAGAVLESLHPRGMVDHLLVHLTQQPGGELMYDIAARLEGVSFRFDGFPYEITDIAGTLAIDANGVSIKSLTGKHKDTPVTLSGRVVMEANRVGVDGSIEALDVRLDDEMFAAMPPNVQKVWQQLSPKGHADVKFSLRHGMGQGGPETDYRCEVTAKDVELTYSEFPYTFRSIRGRAVAMPGRVELHDITSSDGNMTTVVSGVVTSEAKEDRAVLSLKASLVPLDSQLIQALPTGAIPAFNRLTSGGSCDFDLSRVVFTMATGAVAATAPATSSTARATSPTTAALAAARWQVEGSVTLRDANIDLGLGNRCMTGTLQGRVANTDQGLAIDANFILDSLSMSSRVISNLRGQASKAPASKELKIDDLTGKIYGGRLAGFLVIQLAENTMYDLHVSVKDVQLSELANGGVKDANQMIPLEGLLGGDIWLKYIDGPKPSKQAGGKIEITGGKVSRLPIMVEVTQKPVLLAMPGGSVFTEGFSEYTLKGDKLTFQEIHLTDSKERASILGAGTVNMKTEALKFTFLGASGILPRMKNIPDELITGVMRELVEYQVTGTLRRPRFNTVPFRGVQDFFKRMWATE